jgi:CHAT domain-containing protein/Tfp pilus assembly protein PilF
MKLYSQIIAFAARCLLTLVTLISSAPAQGSQGNPTPAEIKPGVVVEKVTEHGEAEKAGVQPEDILLEWSRGDAQGKIRSPFDLTEMEIEQAPRGVVTIKGLRGSESRVWKLGPASWGIKARPNFPESLLARYREGQQLLNSGKPAEAAGRWRTIANQLDGSLSVWLLAHAGDTFSDGHQWKEAADAYQEALEKAGQAEPGTVAVLLRAWAQVFNRQSDWANAEKYFQQSIAESQKLGRESLMIAINLNNLGEIARRRGDLAKAEEYQRQALAMSQKLAPEGLAVAASFSNLGNVAYNRGDIRKAEEYFGQALEIRQKLAPGSLDVAASFNSLGVVARGRGALAKAEEYFGQALEIRQKLSPESLDVATTLNNLGLIASSRGDLGKAEKYHRQALEIRQKLAPGSLDVASSLNNLGVVAVHRGDLVRAEEYHGQALEISQRLAPGSLDVAVSLGNLGIVASDRGDLAKAEEYYGQALNIKQKLAPGSRDIAASFNNLGNISIRKGDLAKADEYFDQALEIWQKSAPGSLDAAASLYNLGIVAFGRGDLAKAEEYCDQALAIRQKLAPGSLDVATSFNCLGLLASHRGDLAKAEKYHSQALELEQKLAPGSLDVATSFNNLGNVAIDRGDLAKAEEYYGQALEIRQKLAPGSLDVAASFNNLGTVASGRRDLAKAEEYFGQALEIKQNLAPGSTSHAETLAALAGMARKDQKLEAAAKLYEQALEALEGQTARLGGAEQVRAGFRAAHADFYRDYVDLLMAQKQTELAFYVSERLRARSMLETLAEGHVDIHKGVAPRLLEQERRLQDQISATINRRISLLTKKHTEEQAAAVTREIEELDSRYQEVEGQIRISSPAYAALTQPQPWNARQVREQLLDPDTLLLEYCLGEERSYLWAVSSGSVTAYELPKRIEIEEIARHLYKLLADRGEDRTKTPIQRKARFRETAARLSRMVLGPVASELAGKRLMIVSDGALQYVPFAALPRPGAGGAGDWVPLVVDHEIISLPSASVLGVLRAERAERKQSAKEVALFADPVFSGNDERVRLARIMKKHGGLAPAAVKQAVKEKDAPVTRAWSTGLLTRSLSDVGLDAGKDFYLPRLPFTRREAQAIMEVIPAGKGTAALDFDASRTNVLNPDLAQYRVVHIATHGLMDSANPELSGLVLSLVDERGRPQDGFLGLQDIYNLNLPVDLVVLSACETGLGKEIKSEGLIGLTRGFMYAGASRVVASLWNTDDAATAELMINFYKAMEQDKMRPAAALRQAQIQMWKKRRWKDPYYWAAFQLHGEWK